MTARKAATPPSVFPMADCMAGQVPNDGKNITISRVSGGETGIRTLGRRKPTTVFETAAFDHSATSPR